MTLEEKQVYQEMLELGYFFDPKITYKEIVNLTDRPFDIETLGPNPFDPNTDIFKINSLTKDGINAYDTYINDNLIAPLNLTEVIEINLSNEHNLSKKLEIMENYKLQESAKRKIHDLILPFLSVRYDKKKDRRMLTYNYEYLFIKVINILQIDYEGVLKKENYKTYYNYVKRCLDNYIDLFSKVLSGKPLNNSEMEFLKKKFGFNIITKAPEDHFIRNINGFNNLSNFLSTNNKKNLKKEYKYIPGEEFNKIKYLYYLSVHLRKSMIKIEQSKPEIDINEFLTLFDPSTLYLIIAKLYLDYALYFEKNHNIGMIYWVSEVKEYVFYLLDKLGRDYNPSIRVYDKSQDKIINYDFNTLKLELNAYLNRYPILYHQPSKEDIEKYDIRSVKDLERYFEIKDSDDSVNTLFASWEFIKKGETGPLDENIKRVKPDRKTNPVKEEEKRLKYNKALMDAKKRSEILSNTNFMYKIIGINSFDGYEGYVYNDGTILLEHVYSDRATKTPCLDAGATYVMNIYNFTKFSKKTKPEIMKYISNTSNPDVERKYHSKNWGANILKLVSGKEMNIDTLLVINNMINNGTLTKVKR